MGTGPLLIVGHRDAAEAGLVDYFSRAGTEVLSSARLGLDARDARDVEAFFAARRPQRVIVGSVRSGGIGLNRARPAELHADNILAQTHVLDAARRHGARRVLYLAASCIYPRDCPQPVRETAFLTGPMEPTSEPYSMAKAAGVALCRAYRQQYGLDAVVGVPATVYGPGGSEDPAEAHALGALLARLRAAREAGDAAITLWGTGSPRREFLHADDLAAACAFLLDHPGELDLVNIGGGEEITIRDLAALLAETCGFRGEVRWDAARPDGAPRKVLDSSLLASLGWRPRVALREGVRSCLDH